MQLNVNGEYCVRCVLVLFIKWIKLINIIREESDDEEDEEEPKTKNIPITQFFNATKDEKKKKRKVHRFYESSSLTKILKLE